MKNYTVTSIQINDMKHCIGFQNDRATGIKHRKYTAWRNYFTTANDDPDWDNLVEQGLLQSKFFLTAAVKVPKLIKFR